MVEFTDLKSVETWCGALPLEEAITFAGISAARYIPGLVRNSGWGEGRIDLFAYRALLVTLVRGKFNESGVRLAARHASSAIMPLNIGPNGPVEFLETIAFVAGIAADGATTEIASLSSAYTPAFAAGFATSALSAYEDASIKASILEAGGVDAIVGSPLWAIEMPKGFAGQWQETLQVRPSDSSVWGFWIDWYEGLLEGRTPDWELWREVALIPNDVWEAGPEAVALAIEGVKARLVKVDPIADAVDASLATTSMPAAKEIEAVQKYITKHRADLPPTFDAIEEYIALEIERLQKDNYLNSHEPEYVRRAIETLLTLHEAITALRVTIPAAGPISTEVAERSIRLFAVYKDKFKKLPIEKADEVVEGVWQTSVGSARVGLIFASTALGGYLGIPPHLAFAGGAMAFAPKQASDLIKAAKEAFTKST